MGLGVVGLVAVMILIVAVLKSCCCGGGSSNKKKTMKAPGKDFRIYRDDFEHDPSTYFRDYRNHGWD